MHQPVLLHEVIENLAIKPNGVYVDATFGRGGHAKKVLEFLSASGRLLVMDKDPEAIKVAQSLQLKDTRVSVKQGSFIFLSNWVKELNLSGKIDGILMDLGVSSPQLDEPNRGFSFMQDGPLDMRMDTTQKLTAEKWVNKASLDEMILVFQEYGEEKFARRIAKAIITEREKQPILTTGRLAEIVKAANPKWEKFKHPATRVFQAIRIFINNELQELIVCLEQCLEILAPGGRLCVITFHSLEDRIVKRFIVQNKRGANLPQGLPVKHAELRIRLKSIGKAMRANEAELKNNIRARSATLRVMEKII
jgi:16S rRNA (cytosine1402-N4)-methyltransferase